METEEPWELFDLEADLQVTLSEDGKEYLRQFGLEQYDFENYHPDDDPGKYFQDVPLEQNPEALFDLLTRDSFRDSSSRRSSATAPPRQSHRKSSARPSPAKPRHDVTGTGQGSGRADPGAAYQNLEVDIDQERLASPKSHNKRVSFTENGVQGIRQADKENKPRDGESRSNRSMSSFFGRPKTKQSKKIENGGLQGGVGSDVRRNQGDNGSPLNNQNNVSTPASREEENARNHKKHKKFKFPVLDLMGRTRRNFGSTKHAGKSDDSVAANSTPGATSSGVTVDRGSYGGVDRVDLLEGSPELGASRGTLTRDADGGTGSCSASVTDSDSDTYMSHRRVPDPGGTSRGDSGGAASPTLPEGLAPPAPLTSGSVSQGGAQHVKMVETVTCRAPESTSNEKREVGRGEHLPPALLAAVTGDLNLLKESVAHLSLESVNKLRDAAGNTVLHASASGGHLPCVEYICRHCPLLLTSENKAHLTPTAMAIKHGQIEVVDWLVENMNLRQELYPSHSRRRCLLHHAAKFGQDGCLRLLLSKMEAVAILQDFTDQNGNTPAHIASKYGHLMCLQTLVEYGMDLCSINQYGHTPCYYADFNNHRHCAGYLMVVETCALLAHQHVDQAKHSQWMQARNDAVTAFTTEALSLSGAIARQSSDDVDVTYRLQQTLDDSMDLVGDMASQLNHLYELTCELQDGVSDKRHLPSPGKDDLRVSMERATELQRRLEELDKAINHQTSRQQLLKVKDVKRRWEAVLSESVPEVRDTQEEAKQLVRKLFSDAVQRLVVYRTNDRSSRQVAQPAMTAPRDLSLPGDVTLRPVASDPRRKEPNIPDAKALGKLSPRARVENPPIKTTTKMYSVSNGHPSRPRALNASGHSIPNSAFIASASAFERQQKTTGLKKGPIDYGNMGPETTIDEAIGASSGSSKDGSFASSNDLDMKSLGTSSSDQQVKNNVVESFLKSRTFYQQDPGAPKSNDSRGSTGGLFYSGQRPNISQMQTADSPGLQTSAFSAFNRVPNRPFVDSKQSTSFDDFRISKEHSQSSSRTSMPSTFVLAGIKKGITQDREDNKERQSEYTMETSLNEKYQELSNEISHSDDISKLPRTKPKEPSILKVTELGQSLKSPYKSTNSNGHIRNMVSQIETQSTSDDKKTRQKSSTQISINSESYEESISEPTIPPPPQPPTVPVKPVLRRSVVNDSHLTPKLVTSHDQSVTSSTDSATTGEDDEELLSDGDLGAELEADDLMLGPHTFLDDEVDEDCEQYADHMFSPEELLALAPGGRLPLSMQFETSLSTIEEVSVVSESTRGDDNTDGEAQGNMGAERHSDSDDTVTHPSDNEDHGNPTETKDLKEKMSQMITPTSAAEGDRPWYETSDDDDGTSGGRRQPHVKDRPEHFTLF